MGDPIEAIAAVDRRDGAIGPLGAPVRVGLVIGQLSTGGAEGQLRLLCQGLDRLAVKPVVYCLSTHTDPYGALLERAGVPLRVISGGRIGRALRLRRALAADGIELVHAWLFIANAYAWTACLGRRCALITSARNCKRQGRWLDAMNVRAFRASARIIVNSPRVQEYIQREYAAPPTRVTVIPNAIDLERFRPRPRPVGAKCVAMVGRLVAQKNPLLFVRAAAALRARLPDARFVLIGDGPLRSHVEAAVRAAGLADCCMLAGERTDVDALLGHTDLFWLTSDWEGLPNGVIEALACGLPVVATDVGGTAELVRTGQEGFLIAPGDGEALVERSVQILADPILHARMRAAARARAEAFGVEQMVRATQAVYERALTRPAG
jgi:glycosyltransferase involved in cell wall biosynthesis